MTPNAALDRSDVLALHEAGKTYGQIAHELGVTRNVVAGLIYRARQPKAPHKAFRDEDHVRNCVRLADMIGLCRAARVLQMDAAQLCRWRQRVRALEAA